MDRFVLAASLIRQRGRLVETSTRAASSAAAAAATTISSTTSAATSSTSRQARPKIRRGEEVLRLKTKSSSDASKTGETKELRFWSILEETEGVSSSEQSLVALKESGLEWTQKLATSSSIKNLDETWREFRKNQPATKDSLLLRAHTVSSLANESFGIRRALGAMHRALNTVDDANREEYLQVFNHTCKSIVNKRIEPHAVLQVIHDVRTKKGKGFLNEQTYALALASVLTVAPPPTSKPAAKVQKARLIPSTTLTTEAITSAPPPTTTTVTTIPEKLDRVKQGAFQTSLAYFKSIFFPPPTATTGDQTENSSEAQTILSIPSSNKDTIFSILTMVKDDFESEPNSRSVSLVFDELLLLLPKMSPNLAGILIENGFPPSPTSFLALLHSCKVEGNAQKALLLLQEMLDKKVERKPIHYIACAFALRIAQEQSPKGSSGDLKPWYFQALLQSYVADFPEREPIDEDFVEALLLGLCRSKLADQDLKLIRDCIKVLRDSKQVQLQLFVENTKAGEEVAATTKKDQPLILSPTVCAALIERLTQGKFEQVEQVLQYMTTNKIERTCEVDEALLRLHLESCTRLERSVQKLRSQEGKGLEAKLSLKQEWITSAERLCLEVIQGKETTRVSKFLGQQLQQPEGDSSQSILTRIRFLSKSTNNEIDVETKMRAIELLSEVYCVTSSSQKLVQLLAAVEADFSSRKEKIKAVVTRKRLMDDLMRCYGRSSECDQAVAIIATMQSEALPIDAQSIQILAWDVFGRNGRLSDAVGYTLGLCRTYKLKPTIVTLSKLFDQSRKEKKKDLENNVVQMYKEFNLDKELEIKMATKSKPSVKS